MDAEFEQSTTQLRDASASELERRMARDGWTMKRKPSKFKVTGTPQYFKPGDEQAYTGLPAVARAYYPDLVVAVAPRSAPRSASAAAPRKAAARAPAEKPATKPAAKSATRAPKTAR